LIRVSAFSVDLAFEFGEAIRRAEIVFDAPRTAVVLTCDAIARVILLKTN